jgi:hypothetical protein
VTRVLLKSFFSLIALAFLFQVKKTVPRTSRVSTAALQPVAIPQQLPPPTKSTSATPSPGTEHGYAVFGHLRLANLIFRRIFGQPNLFFGGFSAGPNFSAAAAKFGGWHL